MAKIILEVAVPISFALNEPFDYWPAENQLSPEVGSRVLVPFRNRVVLGYVVKIKDHSAFEKKLRPIIRNLDQKPLLDTELFGLAHKIQKDYFCSLAEAISAVLPPGLKKAKKDTEENDEILKQNIPLLSLSAEEENFLADKETSKSLVLIHDLSNKNRWTCYAALIKKTLNDKKSVLFLVPDHEKIELAIKNLRVNVTPYIITSGASASRSLQTWQGVRQSPFSFVVGTRSAIFAPVRNLGLVVLEEEEHFAYRQDQVPFYRTHDIALRRAQDHKAQVVLGSFMPSLDAYNLIHELDGGYLKIARTAPAPLVRLIDMRQEFRFKAKGREKSVSKILEYRLAHALENKEKALIFVNQKGFSTFLYCQRCKKTQTCPSCSSSLKYHFKEKLVSCPTCSYQAKSFDICPQCKSAYVKYGGYGVEKVESELLHLFPTVKIFTYEKGKMLPESYDIMLVTQQFLEEPSWGSFVFDIVAVAACDQMLGHLDFRSTERTFAKLLRLFTMARQELCLQTHMVDHPALNFLSKGDPEGFLKQELIQRRESDLPPAALMASLMIRSHSQSKTQEVADAFYKKLKGKRSLGKNFKFFEPAAAVPLKVRQNFRYQILMRYKELKPLHKSILALIEDRPKGVIVTFDPSI